MPDRSTLGDLIVDGGLRPSGVTFGIDLDNGIITDSAHINALRDELIRLRRIEVDAGEIARSGLKALEDQRRFQVDALGVHCEATVVLACDRCGWTAEIDGPISSADLIDRAAEHAEVCP